MSRSVRCGSRPFKHEQAVWWTRQVHQTPLIGSPSSGIEGSPGCGEAGSRWRGRNANARGMCIGKSKSARSLRPPAGQNVRGLAPGVFVDQAGHKHDVARRAKAEDKGSLLYALAVKYGLQRAHQLVVLGDGAAWIWRLVAEHFAGAVQIVDIWHAREHVWKVARAVFGANTPEA